MTTDAERSGSAQLLTTVVLALGPFAVFLAVLWTGKGDDILSFVAAVHWAFTCVAVASAVAMNLRDVAPWRKHAASAAAGIAVLWH